MLPVHGINSRSGRKHWPEYKSLAPLLGVANGTSKTWLSENFDRISKSRKRF